MDPTQQQLDAAIATLWGGIPPRKLASLAIEKQLKYGFELADTKLYKVGVMAGPETADEVAKQLTELGAKKPSSSDNWLAEIVKTLSLQQGPGQDAGSKMWSLATLALGQRYKLADLNVRKAFCDFMIMLITDQYKPELGTTMGNATHANADVQGKYYSDGRWN